MAQEKIQFTVSNEKHEIKYSDTLVKNTDYSSLKIKIEKADSNEEFDFETYYIKRYKVSILQFTILCMT